MSSIADKYLIETKVKTKYLEHVLNIIGYKMVFHSILAFLIYLSIIMGIGIFSSHKAKSSSDFVLGDRGLNYWIAAISASASDMSVWLFMGLPMAIYLNGISQAWAAFGLVFFMFLNWHFVAPKLRKATEECNSLTLFSFFEKRIGEKAYSIRAIGALFATFFLTIYVAAGITGMGYLFESIFGINYTLGCVVSIFAILTYVSFGGFTAICNTDFVQGMFLLVVILLIPILIFIDPNNTNTEGLTKALSKPIVQFNFKSIIETISLTIGWGVGYFGQPHILNKFMAIKNIDEIHKSKWLGTLWQVLALFGAILSGLAATYFFDRVPDNTELIFVDMVKSLFNPFAASFILCAILAATLSTIDSQVIVLASVITEDFYHALVKDNAKNSKRALFISRLSTITVCLVALLISLMKSSSIFHMVYYCWVGIGSSFGPLVIASLYFKNLTKNAALIGMITGGLIGTFWIFLETELSAAVPGFLSGIISIWLITKFSRKNQLTA